MDPPSYSNCNPYYVHQLSNGQYLYISIDKVYIKYKKQFGKSFREVTDENPLKLDEIDIKDFNFENLHCDNEYNNCIVSSLSDNNLSYLLKVKLETEQEYKTRIIKLEQEDQVKDIKKIKQLIIDNQKLHEKIEQLSYLNSLLFDSDNMITSLTNDKYNIKEFTFLLEQIRLKPENVKQLFHNLIIRVGNNGTYIVGILNLKYNLLLPLQKLQILINTNLKEVLLYLQEILDLDEKNKYNYILCNISKILPFPKKNLIQLLQTYPNGSDLNLDTKNINFMTFFTNYFNLTEDIFQTFNLYMKCPLNATFTELLEYHQRKNEIEQGKKTPSYFHRKLIDHIKSELSTTTEIYIFPIWIEKNYNEIQDECIITEIKSILIDLIPEEIRNLYYKFIIDVLSL